MSRRQLLNAAWKLGAAAVLQPVVSSRVFAQGRVRHLPVHARRRIRRSVARRRRAVDPARARPAQWRRHADGERGSRLGDRARQAFRAIEQKGVAIARPELGTACTSKSTACSLVANTGIAFTPAARSVRSAARGQRRPRARRSIGCASRVCGCSHYETGYFTAFRGIAEEQFDFVFHTGDYIYEDRADGGTQAARVRQHIEPGNLHASATTGTATRCTSPIAI